MDFIVYKYAVFDLAVATRRFVEGLQDSAAFVLSSLEDLEESIEDCFEGILESPGVAQVYTLLTFIIIYFVLS